MELQIRDLAKTYANGVRALDRVSLTVSTGMFGLLGPNGAGKSTLMRTLATLQDADAGSATLKGLPGGDIDVLRDKDAVRQVLGYLPQDFGVYPKVSAQDLLDHFARLKGLVDAPSRRQTVEALLQRVNLHAVRKHHLGGFSGGMRQRFGIAQALLCDPKLASASTTCSPTSPPTSSSSCRPTSSATSPTCAASSRSSTPAACC
jgi:ABC-2 type transport system ATP-binding protein